MRGVLPFAVSRLARAAPHFDGAGALLVARVLQLAGSFSISLAVVWGYGLAGAGTLALASLPAALGGHVICLGLQSALPRMAFSSGQSATIGTVTSTFMGLLTVPPILLYAALVAQSSGEAFAIATLALAGALGGQGNVAQILYVMQERQKSAPLMPAIYLLGIGLSMTAPSLVDFSFGVLAARLASSVAGFAMLSYERVRFADLTRAAREGTRFAPLDVAGLLAEQLPIVLISPLLSRAELGVIGLLRQFVTVADMPGFSYIFNSYPTLVSGTAEKRALIARRNERLSWISAAGTLVVASLAAWFVYRAPILLVALPVVLLPMPARYIGNFCDYALRAAGLVADCAGLALVKIVISLLLYGAMTAAWGLWGAVAASILVSVIGGLIYRGRFVSRFPGSIGPIRLWRLA